MWGMVLETFVAPLPLKACLQSVNVGNSMPCDSGVFPIMEVDAIIEALRKHLQRTHSHALHYPRAALSAGVNSCFYHQQFRLFRKRRRYCQQPVSGRRMQRFLQFRLGSPNLPVFAGRFCGLARANRVCTHCGGIAVAAELHMVHECLVFQPLRQQYAALSTSNTDRTTCKVSGLVQVCLRLC